MTSEDENTESTVATAMRVRVYPTSGQTNKLSTWLYVAQSFRNSVVAVISDRRKARGKWFAQHKSLSKEEAKKLIPENLTGSDSAFVSKWLTGQLEKAREFAAREFFLDCSKTQLGERFVSSWAQLSRGEKEEVRERCHGLGIHLDWLLVSRTVLDQVVRDLDKTISKAIKDRMVGPDGRKKKRKAGFPVFRKHRYPSGIRIQVTPERNSTYREAWERGQVVLPGLGRLKVREAGYNGPASPPKLITLTRNAAGQWHLSCICLGGELKNARRRKQEQGAVPDSWGKLPLDEHGLPAIEGLDMSLSDFAVSNKHGKFGRERHNKRYARKKRLTSKAVSRKQKGSGRWKKAVRKLGRVEVKVANVRDAGLRKAANIIADRSAIVCVETLYLAGMAKTTLAKSVYDLGWGKFLTYLEAAMTARGHLLIKAGAFSPTTQACSTEGCNYINRSLKQNLKTRKWDCLDCGTHHCRDTNAAENIEKDALRIFFESLGEESALVVDRLHPELQDHLARGGAASFATVSSVAESRQALPGFVPGKRELTLLCLFERNEKA